MSRCVIVGSMQVDSRIKEFINDSFVIAADAGVRNLEALNIKPDLIVGDFDSLGFVPEGDNVIKYPVKKDDTDMMLAVKEAINLGYNDIMIFGGCEGRIDHTLANINTMVYRLKHGVSVSMIDEKSDFYVTDDELKIKCRDNYNLSLFALEKHAVIDIEGAVYSGKNIEISNDNTLGVSNSFEGQDVTINVKEGIVLVVLSLED